MFSWNWQMLGSSEFSVDDWMHTCTCKHTKEKKSRRHNNDHSSSDTRQRFLWCTWPRLCLNYIMNTEWCASTASSCVHPLLTSQLNKPQFASLNQPWWRHLHHGNQQIPWVRTICADSQLIRPGASRVFSQTTISQVTHCWSCSRLFCVAWSTRKLCLSRGQRKV